MPAKPTLESILQTITRQTRGKFQPASPAGMAKLKEYKLPTTLLDFYQNHEPAQPIFGQIQLLNVQRMIEENEQAWPGACILKHGYVVMASNDGDAYCYDLNSNKTHPVIVLISHELPNPDFTREDCEKIAKPVATDLLDFLEQFTRNAIDEETIISF